MLELNSSEHILWCYWRSDSGRLRFHGAGKSGRNRRHVYQYSVRGACGSWLSTQCASLDVRCPMGFPSRAARRWRVSTGQSLLDLFCTSLEPLLNLFGTSLEPLRNLLRTSLEPLWNFSGTSPGPLWYPLALY